MIELIKDKLDNNRPVIAGVRITWLKKTFYFDITKIFKNGRKATSRK